MSQQGNWLGQWAGQWFGSLDELPPGFISAAATISVNASGPLTGIGVLAAVSSISVEASGDATAIGHMQGGASLSLSSFGDVSNTSGGSADVRASWFQFSPISAAIYAGWFQFETVSADVRAGWFKFEPMAAQVCMGWAAFSSTYQRPELEPAGHWKHLFKAARDASVDFRRVAGEARVAFLRPEVAAVRRDAEVAVQPVMGVAQVAGFVLPASASAPLASVCGRSRVGRVRVRGWAAVYIGSCQGGSSVSFGASGAAFVSWVTTGGTGFVDRVTVKAVQNPTEEMLAVLL